jgi:hypothetical protein
VQQPFGTVEQEIERELELLVAASTDAGKVAFRRRPGDGQDVRVFPEGVPYRGSSAG